MKIFIIYNIKILQKINVLFMENFKFHYIKIK